MLHTFPFFMELKNIEFLTPTNSFHSQGRNAIANLLNVPASAVLTAVKGLLSFTMAQAQVQVPNTLWKEPGVLWLAIGMPTGK